MNLSTRNKSCFVNILENKRKKTDLFEVPLCLDGAIVVTIPVANHVASAVGDPSTPGLATRQSFTPGVDVPPPVIGQRQILLCFFNMLKNKDNIEKKSFNKKYHHHISKEDML